MPIIFMTRRFTRQVDKLDGTLRSKVLAFMAKIQTGRPGLNIESLKNAADPRVRTARVDLNHRAVMIQAGADVYGLLAVDTHDKANKYAEHGNRGSGHLRRRCRPSLPGAGGRGCCREPSRCRAGRG